MAVSEIGFPIFHCPTGLQPGPISTGGPNHVDIALGTPPPGCTLDSLLHTHPNGGIPMPSTTDIRSAVDLGIEKLYIESGGELVGWNVNING